mmetsp:Transcript_18177/g.21375  ORF Transcript_18177/g.21375 Transcript_18177/m.21375 type:complete len:91 (-) Transcript_18177:404-676(-)
MGLRAVDLGVLLHRCYLARLAAQLPRFASDNNQLSRAKSRHHAIVPRLETGFFDSLPGSDDAALLKVGMRVETLDGVECAIVGAEPAEDV